MKKLLILLSATAMICAFSFTAAASDFDFYGSLRFQTFSEDFSKETQDTGKSDTDTKWGTIGTSRIGSKIKLSENITGLFELAVEAVGNDALSVRHFYGEYDFGLGKILIGQTWHPSSAIACYSSQIWDGDDGLGEHGAFYGGRSEMIKLSFGNFGLYFIEPIIKNFDFFEANTVFGHNDPIRDSASTDFDKSIPQIAASYTFTYDKLTLEGMAAYQHYEFTDYNNSTATKNPRPNHYDKSLDVNSNFFKIGATVDLDPFTFSGSYGWGDNIGNMGILAYSHYGYNPVAIYAEGTKAPIGPAGIYDVETSGYTLVAGIKINDMLSFQTGYGYIENETDYWAHFKNTEAHSYYLQAQIKILDGFVITPEIGKIEYGDQYTFEKANEDTEMYDGGDISYFGAKWQIDF